ncbi:histidinol dehydrogenase [Helicobacter sp. faydin-H20]|uniref:histidinol dehydrogenase n=1 Tax=Helicobacter anatolicus TaxID=2905874 RepID=UPI001E4A90E4|nr:histidinol dehydrogenase [Helicobacter anatolicus]MCE3037285.1 histidinol dehydrogenase [Helicobacter anatolicus]
MKIIKTTQDNFSQVFQNICNRGKVDSKNVIVKVMEILDSIQQGGNQAVLQQVAMFDNWQPGSIEDLRISFDSCKNAYEKLDSIDKKALHQAYDRIYAFHSKQKAKSWLDFEDNGNILGQKITPVERAGLYIPGGKAFYPSSLLMNAIPAIVAGVNEIVVCSPTPNNTPNSLYLAALYLCGIKEAYKVGGAGAIGMMAYGTESIKKVDVITGPGNIFVATAKKMVFGDVMIDMVAGPSEIVVIADKSADARSVANDLLAQAEHDEMASAILLTDSKELSQEIQEILMQTLPTLQRENIATTSLKDRGVIILCRDIKECLNLSNTLAPEHLELLIANPLEMLAHIKHSGAIFIGPYAPEAMGDYIAGPNHTLPTGGSARFFSPLSVEHFMKKSSIIYLSKEGFEDLAPSCERLAEIEGLGAHRNSISVRRK